MRIYRQISKINFQINKLNEYIKNKAKGLTQKENVLGGGG